MKKDSKKLKRVKKPKVKQSIKKRLIKKSDILPCFTRYYTDSFKKR